MTVTELQKQLRFCVLYTNIVEKCTFRVGIG